MLPSGAMLVEEKVGTGLELPDVAAAAPTEGGGVDLYPIRVLQDEPGRHEDDELAGLVEPAPWPLPPVAGGDPWPPPPARSIEAISVSMLHLTLFPLFPLPCRDSAADSVTL